jgi:proteic killer suppression protein
MICRVELSRVAEKQLGKLPPHILDKLDSWIMAVELSGLEEVRKIKGYHDEKLKGNRLGERSIRLSRSYRAIYRVIEQDIQFVRIEEVNKHDY